MPSSVIRDIEYDAEREQLFVTFVSGKLYVYEPVPAEVHGAFATASSKGEFFNRFIRDRFRHREVMRAS
jgi:hypothetical protein